MAYFDKDEVTPLTRYGNFFVSFPRNLDQGHLLNDPLFVPPE